MGLGHQEFTESANHGWPTMGFESTTYLFLSGGLSRARKRFHAGLSLYRESIACCCPSLTFDHDHFGPRSYEMDVNLRGSINNGWVDERLYLRFLGQPERPEPPHMAYALTEPGRRAAMDFLRALEHTGVEIDPADFAARLLAFNWMPQNIAVCKSMATHSLEPLGPPSKELDFPLALVLTDRNRPVGVDDLQKFAAWLEKPGYLRFRETPRRAGNSVRFSFSIIGSELPRKYRYLRVSHKDMEDAQGALRDVSSRYVPMHLQNVPDTDSFIRTLAENTTALFRAFPQAQECWQDVAKDILEKFPFEKADKEWQKRVLVAQKVAELSEDHPIDCTLSVTEHGLQVRIEDWAGTGNAQDIVRQCGLRGLQSHLRDPADTFSYLVAYSIPRAWDRIQATQ